MTDHFRNIALLAVAAITSLAIAGCGSTATPGPTQPPSTPGTPAQTTGLPAGSQ